MNPVIENPYRVPTLPWLRGNLHAHTTGSDGVREPQAVVDAYASCGYDFLMISDHDHLVNVSRLDPRGMALISGNEITANGPHILHMDARTVVPPSADRQRVINAILEDGAVAIIAHPNWERNFAHCPQDRLEAWQRYTGIEIYNGVVRRLQGSPLATDRWDRLLALGRRVWGYANDDSHRPEDDAIAWNMVQAERKHPAAIVDALRHGRFYASTGVTIERIHVTDRTITVSTRDAQRIVVHSDFGHREAAVDGPAASFTVPDSPTMSYVRFECWGSGEAMAWTQPFFIRRE